MRKNIDHIATSKDATYGVVKHLLKNRIPLNVIESANVCSKNADSNLQIVERFLPKVACKIGCNHCCYLVVEDVFAPEIFRIAKYISEKEQIIKELKSIVAITRVDKNNFNIPPIKCPFLKDGLCEIYEIRPNTCMRFTSYNEVKCRHDNTNDDIPLSVSRFTAGQLPHIGLKKALRNSGLDCRSLDFHHALLIALTTDNAMEKWLNNEPVFEEAVAVANEALESVNMQSENATVDNIKEKMRSFIEKDDATEFLINIYQEKK